MNHPAHNSLVSTLLVTIHAICSERLGSGGSAFELAGELKEGEGNTL